jgi:serine/threonine-protein kinase
MQLAEGLVVAGRFRLGQMLGRGGMGSVWRAVHLGLDVPCAVKFIEGDLASLPEAQARFEREAKAAAQLRSPHVVQILDHGVWEGTPYIAMELLEGEDLGKRIARVGRLAPPDTHAIVAQVCRALAKAHAAGIVHRDLKPDNIFLVRDDDREITKVLDFGIAKSHSQELGGSSNTKTGAMLGTPYYMSPEQAQGIRQVDFRTDLWALAIIVFQALTGRLPFESEALGDLLVKIIVSPLPTPSQFGPVPPGFDAWWAKAAARDPAERFQGAKEFADSLAMVCGVSQASGITDLSQVGVRPAQPSFATSAGIGAPIGTGSPVSRTLPPGVRSGRARAVVAGAIGGVALLVGIGGAAFWKWNASNAAGEHAAAAARAVDVPASAAPMAPMASAPAVALAPPPTAPPAAATTPDPSASAASQPAASSAPVAQVAQVAQAPARTSAPPAKHAGGAGAGAGQAHTSAATATPAKSGKAVFNAGF